MTFTKIANNTLMDFLTTGKRLILIFQLSHFPFNISNHKMSDSAVFVCSAILLIALDCTGVDVSLFHNTVGTAQV